MPARLIGNGLRELDLFLTDLIVEAGRLDRLGASAGADPGVHPQRRIFSAAEAWRRGALRLGLPAEGRARLRQMRAAQNRHCFGTWRDAGSGVAMQRASPATCWRRCAAGRGRGISPPFGKADSTAAPVGFAVVLAPGPGAIGENSAHLSLSLSV